MAIPNPNPNIADYQKSDNKTYSSNKIESLIKTATELPIPAAGDSGKVLTVNSGATGYELDTPLTIDDTAASDSTTYSSSKINDLIDPLTSKYELVYNDTLAESTQNIILDDNISYKNIIIVVDLLSDQTTTMYAQTYIKTDKNSSYFLSSAISSTSITSGNNYRSLTTININNGLITATSTLGGSNSICNINKSPINEFITNMFADEITAIKFNTSINLPIGTVIKIYAC